MGGTSAGHVRPQEIRDLGVGGRGEIVDRLGIAAEIDEHRTGVERASALVLASRQVEEWSALWAAAAAS